MSHLLIRTAAVAMFLALPLTAHAQLITFDFTATVSSVPAALTGGPIVPGRTVTGSFTFDPTVSDSDPSEVFGVYRNLVGFEVAIPLAGYAAAGSPGTEPGRIEAWNDEGGSDGVRRDRYVVTMSTPGQTFSGPDVNGFPLIRLAIVLRDRGTVEEPPTAFTSDELPLVPPSLAAFPIGMDLILEFDTGGGPGETFSTLTSLTSSQVTVPDQIDAIVDSVGDLELDGIINGGQANSLNQKLEQALAHVSAGQTGPAINVLEAFVNQVNAYIRSRRLTPAEGAALIAAAQSVIAELESGAP